tara:strand:+ start:360 stop:530 length:171 start_codon:yes stop_codon:yes gene_type:complete
LVNKELELYQPARVCEVLVGVGNTNATLPVVKVALGIALPPLELYVIVKVEKIVRL